MDQQAVKEEPFPAPSLSAMGKVGGVDTDASAILFSDRILLTLSQDGRLSHWVNSESSLHLSLRPSLGAPKMLTILLQIQVPLSAPSSASLEMALPPAAGGRPQLPALHLQPKTLLGHGGERESLGHVYAAHIASYLALKDPADRRTLVLGLGLRDVKDEDEDDKKMERFFDVLELVQQVL